MTVPAISFATAVAVVVGRPLAVAASVLFVFRHLKSPFVRFSALLPSVSVSAGWDAELDMSTNVQNCLFLRGVPTEMSTPAPSEEELKELRRRMVTSAARYLPRADAEDVTQQALLRLVTDRRPSSVPLRTRAHRKLKDVRAELFRDNQRKFDVAARPLPEAVEQEDPEGQAIAGLIALEQEIRAVAGEEILIYARAKAKGLTNAEVAAELGWSPQQVEAARKQLSRKTAPLAKLIEESAP
jgi:DNA-directed RNA polymerase specialized sigma24 family protein